MSKYIPVVGHPNLYRDSESGAIINCDSMGYNQYISLLNRRESEKKEIDDMKNDIQEIKTLLKQFINNES
jgi:hypothetical protein